MLIITLLALEGMSRIAYYAAYEQWYGRPGPDAEMNFPSAPPPRFSAPYRIPHPFYGFTAGSPAHDLNAAPPWPRREDTVIIGLVGGSVANDVKPYFQRALNRYFAAHNLPRQPLVLDLAIGDGRQPLQTIRVANILTQGGDFDLIVNLDGRNEIAGSLIRNFRYGVFPFFPMQWDNRSGWTHEHTLLLGRIGILRQEQARLTAVGEVSPLRPSALFGLVNRYRQEKIAAEIIGLNHQLATIESTYDLERHGPRNWLHQEEELLPEAARVWYRGSLALARLTAMAGVDYYHFLQPNQYVPGAKPLSAEEREIAYTPNRRHGYFAKLGYPFLRAFNQDLQKQGINYFDLTGIFVGNPETLYQDICCHLNKRGNELLAAEMIRRLEPSLLRHGRAAAGPVSALAAGRRPVADTLLVDGAFQVYLAANGQWLRYIRRNCAPEDTEPVFFLHLTPQALPYLPPHRRGDGFDNLDFSFADAAGHIWQGQCRAQFRLPGYPLAALRTGQYAADSEVLWAGDFTFPE